MTTGEEVEIALGVATGIFLALGVATGIFLALVLGDQNANTEEGE